MSALHGLALPLNFPSPLAELNLLSILCLLNFASGYRVPLHAETGRGAWDCIRAFVFSLYLSSSIGHGDLLSATGMQSINEMTVAELMRVKVHVEKPHESIPAITVGELGGPLYELVKLIAGVLNETGKILIDAGYPDLGTFVAECLKEGEKARSTDSEDAGVDAILERVRWPRTFYVSQFLDYRLFAPSQHFRIWLSLENNVRYTMHIYVRECSKANLYSHILFQKSPLSDSCYQCSFRFHVAVSFPNSLYNTPTGLH